MPGARLLDLVAVVDRLRTGCPWDARQTHASLARYLQEEAYEALDALDRADAAALREELGDVLFQVVFHARIAAERADGTGWSIDDVADALIAKLTRRHPHVFGDVSVTGADEVMANWDAIKAAERAAAGRPSALEGVPLAQPALALAAALQRRARRAGAPQGLPAGDPRVSETGAALFDLAARANAAGLDPEQELRAAAAAFAGQVRAWERESVGEPDGPAPA